MTDFCLLLYCLQWVLFTHVIFLYLQSTVPFPSPDILFPDSSGITVCLWMMLSNPCSCHAGRFNTAEAADSPENEGAFIPCHQAFIS